VSKPKLTPWFPGTVRPVRDGVYKMFIGSFARFTGGEWRWMCKSMAEAADAIRPSLNPYPHDRTTGSYRWGGLAHPPKESK